MSSEFSVEVELALITMRAHHEQRRAPTDSTLAQARTLLNGAERLTERLPEDTQKKLDELHGLFTWGRLMAPLAYLDPRIMALERTERRARQAALEAEEHLRREALDNAVADVGATEVVTGAPQKATPRVPSESPSDAPAAAPDTRKKRKRGPYRR